MGGLRGTVGALRAKWSCLRIAVLWYWLFGGKTAYVTGTWKPRDRVLVATHRTAGCMGPSEVSLAGHGLALRDVSGAIRLWPTGDDGIGRRQSRELVSLYPIFSISLQCSTAALRHP